MHGYVVAAAAGLLEAHIDEGRPVEPPAVSLVHHPDLMGHFLPGGDRGVGTSDSVVGLGCLVMTSDSLVVTSDSPVGTSDSLVGTGDRRLGTGDRRVGTSYS